MRLPAEWETHAATWIAWPCRMVLWPDYDATCQAYARVIGTIAECEKVKLLVNKAQFERASALCRHSNIEWIVLPFDDSWTRDTLPTFLHDTKTLRAVNWRFNAWGEKYQPFDQDALLGERVAKHVNVSDLVSPDMVLEGGAINSNGEGILLSTRSCLFNSNRQTHCSREEIEKTLKTHLCASELLCFKQGLLEDKDTDGHVDNIACFIDRDTVLLQGFDEGDHNFSGFKQNLVDCYESPHVKHVTAVDGPKPVSYKGERLAASYLNFYFARDIVLIPSFNQKRQDDCAKQFFNDLFPKRTVVQLPVLDILVGGGGIHCITHEEPFVS